MRFSPVSSRIGMILATPVLCSLLATVGFGQGQPLPRFLYVNDNQQAPGGNTVSGYKVGPDRRLTPIKGSPFPTGGFGYGSIVVPDELLTTSVLGDHLFAVNGGNRTISVFKINPRTGRLKSAPGSPFRFAGPAG